MLAGILAGLAAGAHDGSAVLGRRIAWGVFAVTNAVNKARRRRSARAT